MNSQLIHELTVLALAVFVGFEVISKVPTMLHTPLMSGTNAIHGIVIVGAMIVAGTAHADGLLQVIGFVAMVLAFPGVVQAELYLQAGETIRPVRLDGDRRGYVIAVADTNVEALERAEAAARLVDVLVE